MTEPLAIAYEPAEPLTLTNVIGIATGEPIPPAMPKPKRKYTRKAKRKYMSKAERATISKVNAAIMPNQTDGVATLAGNQATAPAVAWTPPIPPVSRMRSIYDLLTPPGGNQGTRIFRRSERFWLLLLSALSVSIGATAAVYWW